MSSPGNEEELFKRSNSELKCQQSRHEANLTGHYCLFKIPYHNLLVSVANISYAEGSFKTSIFFLRG